MNEAIYDIKTEVWKELFSKTKEKNEVEEVDKIILLTISKTAEAVFKELDWNDDAEACERIKQKYLTNPASAKEGE